MIQPVLVMTYHFEVLCSAFGAMEVAGEQHLVDVMTGAVVKFPHVEGSRLEIVEVGFDLQALQDALLHEVNVPDLIPAQRGQRNTSYISKCYVLGPVVWYGSMDFFEQCAFTGNNHCRMKKQAS